MNNISRHLKFILSACAIVVFVQCSEDDPVEQSDQEAIDQALIEEYLAENDTNAVALESGVHYTILDTVPTGASASGQIVSIYYTAKDISKDQGFDQRIRSLHDSVKLKQGVNAVYPVGLDEGIGLMRVGETFRFYIPSSLGFGDYSSSLVSENAILEIEVELTAIHTAAEILAAELDSIDAYIVAESLNDTVANPTDSVEFLIAEQIYYKRMSEGTEDDTLRTNDVATISYIGTTLDNSEFDRRSQAEPLTYSFGNGVVIQGLDDGVSAMERGETALIILPSHKAYGESVFLVVPQADKEAFVEREIIPQYATKVAPYEIIIFETSLLNNP